MNLFKNEKTRYRNLILLLIPFILGVGFFSYLTYASLSGLVSQNPEDQYKYSIDEYDYHLRLNATDLQISLFKDLQDVLSEETVDDAEASKLVCENFVADFYTWTNKSGPYDVGGLYYVYSPDKTSIYYDARNNFYKYLSYYADKYGSENLLEVESITATVSVINEGYTFRDDGGTCTIAYYVSCEWQYKVSNEFNTSQFSNKERFTVIKNAEGRYEIVEGC